jgi:DNA-binding response OmpR family regulator
MPRHAGAAIAAEAASSAPLPRPGDDTEAMGHAPARRVPSPPPATAVADDRASIKNDARVLLVIDDDPLFAKVLYDLAHELGFDCLVAATADEGMELALQFRLAAVLLDIKLPDHSGLTVLDRLKHNPATRHVPVQVISAEDNSRAARAMGAAGALVKPVDRESLIATLGALKARFANERRTVLVVERYDERGRGRQCGRGARSAPRHDVRLHGARPVAARRERLRTARAHGGRRLLRVSSRHRVHRPRDFRGGRAAAAQVFALDHHQGRQVARTPARRGEPVPASS